MVVFKGDMSFNKIILITVVFMLASCTSKKQEPAITWLYEYGQIEKLNGNVKSVTEMPWFSDHGNRYYVTNFDKKGNIVNIRDGESLTQYLTICDKTGRKVEAIHVYKDVEGDTTGKNIVEKTVKEIYIYDNNQHLTRCIDNANDPSTDTDRYFYNNAGNVIEHQQYFERKPLWIFKVRYLYNKSGVCTGVEQSMTSWHDNFKAVTLDTTRYIAFDSRKNWLKSVNFLNDTATRKITYY